MKCPKCGHTMPPSDADGSAQEHLGHASEPLGGYSPRATVVLHTEEALVGSTALNLQQRLRCPACKERMTFPVCPGCGGSCLVLTDPRSAWFWRGWIMLFSRPLVAKLRCETCRWSSKAAACPHCHATFLLSDALGLWV